MVFIFHNYPLELFMFKIRNYTSNWCNKSSEIVEKFIKNCDKLHPYLAELGVVFSHPLGLTVAEIPIQVGHEFKTGAEHTIWYHADSVHILSKWPDNGRNVKQLADRRCHTDVGET